MLIHVEHNVRLFVDVEGMALAPDGARMREKPTLILLHGGPGFDHSTFKPVFSQLTDIAQIIYYDHRGHGRSDARPLSELTLDAHADDIVRLCAALGIVKPIVLGQSFGGFVAQRYIARHPSHAAKIILSSTSHSMNLERKLAMFEKLGGPSARIAAENFWREANDATWAAYSQHCRQHYNVKKPANEAAGKRSLYNMGILYHFVNGEKQQMNLLPDVTQAACPVLVLAGEVDPVCPIEDAREIFEALPHTWRQFRSIANAGHGTWRDQEAEAMSALRAFITA